MMPTLFQPGAPLRASDLDRVAGEASAAQIPAAGFMIFQNGSAIVPRNPRRMPGSHPHRLVPADVCPAVIRGDTGVPGRYKVWLYPNGIGGHGGCEATVSMTEFGVENDLPSGTVVLAHAIAIAAAEDGED